MPLEAHIMYVLLDLCLGVCVEIAADRGRGQNVRMQGVWTSPNRDYDFMLSVRLDCLRDLAVPTTERISHKVDFTLSFISTPTDPDDGVQCMHGPTECLGNIELCAVCLYPDPKLYLGFTMCLSNQYPQIPDRDLVYNCALEQGISFDNINDCASNESGQGMGMLRDSVTRSMDANVSTS